MGAQMLFSLVLSMRGKSLSTDPMGQDLVPPEGVRVFEMSDNQFH